ncbi:MAG TPA: response regulator transcription factor [Planctomycetaceae bacterium]|nr:response regulator transcription factor [Planctomycetaceae bacterium]
MSRPIRVLIADDHPMVRSALASFLEGLGDVEIVGQAEDGDEAAELVPKLQPDVVLMDYSMPRMNGAEATRRIVASCPNVRVVGLSFHAAEFGEQMCQAGAVACVTKSSDLDELVAAVRIAGTWQARHLR